MDLEVLRFGWRGLRISCWIVGIPVYPRTVFVSGAMGEAQSGFKFCTLPCDKAKTPQRIRTEESEAVGHQRIGSALDRILTT
ncbi:hypothetical protein ACFQDZ_15320 [Sulfitobacter pacificus]